MIGTSVIKQLTKITRVMNKNEFELYESIDRAEFGVFTYHDGRFSLTI